MAAWLALLRLSSTPAAPLAAGFPSWPAPQLTVNDEICKELSSSPPPLPSPSSVCAVLVAVRQLTVNDEICKEFADDGGVLAVAAVLGEDAAGREGGH